MGAMGKLAGLLLAFQWVDERLRRLSEAARRVLRLLRVLYFLLVLGIVLVLASAVVGIWWPEWFPVAYAVAVVFLLIPLVALAAVVSAPLRMKRLVALIERGYPGNAREIGIRTLAMKWRDQSIETEELLVETALNEFRKWREQKARADAQPPAAGAPHTPPPPDGPAPPAPPAGGGPPGA